MDWRLLQTNTRGPSRPVHVPRQRGRHNSLGTRFGVHGPTLRYVSLYVASAHNNSREQLPGERPGPLRVYYRRPCGGIDITVKNVALK